VSYAILESTEIIPYVFGKQIVAGKQEDDIHDQVKHQEHAFQPRWNGTPTDRILAMLTECRGKKQVFPNPQTLDVRLCAVMTRSTSSCGQERCAAIDEPDEDDKTPESIHSPAGIC
jgi:hypothetical protein